MLKIKKTKEGQAIYLQLKNAVEKYIELQGPEIDRWIDSQTKCMNKPSPRRIRWDVTRAAMNVINQVRLHVFICDKIYPLDLHDNHIDNTLKSIFRELELPYGY